MSDARECIKRAEYCANLAENEADPQLRELFAKLATQWVEVARDNTNAIAHKPDEQGICSG